MADIFQKTTAGYDEIVRRTNTLSARLRRCLILIDGKRSMLDLIDLLQGEDISPLVQTLEIEGYIELIGSAAAIMPLRAIKPSSTAPTSKVTQTSDFSSKSFTDSKGQIRQPLGFADRKLRAVRVINELLGPNAESVAISIEASTNNEALEKVLHTAAAFVSETINPVAAKRFKDHVRLSDVPL